MTRQKFPRTPHLPFSEGATSDDKQLPNCSIFENKIVVVTEKIDGEATTIYPDGYSHARSTDSGRHPSRSWIKQLAAVMGHMIPKDWRICGENMFAHHSIFYDQLPSYFFVYGVFNQDNLCLSWLQTQEWAALLGLTPVPEIYCGMWDEKLIQEIWRGRGQYPTFELKEAKDNPTFPADFKPCAAEGYVVRLADAFPYEEYANSVAKWVRKNHVQTDEHWLQKPVLPNRLIAVA